MWSTVSAPWRPQSQQTSEALRIAVRSFFQAAVFRPLRSVWVMAAYGLPMTFLGVGGGWALEVVGDGLGHCGYPLVDWSGAWVSGGGA